MANKKRRNKKLRRQQAALRPDNWQPDSGDSDEPQAAAVAATAGPASSAPAAPREVPAYAAGIRGPRRGGGAAATTTTTIDIDARVPYFASDLRRIAITAVLLGAVIVAASFFIR